MNTERRRRSIDLINELNAEHLEKDQDCDSPILTGGKIEAKHNPEKVSLRIGLPPCPHHGSVRLRLSTGQSAGACPQSPAPELLGT